MSDSTLLKASGNALLNFKNIPIIDLQSARHPDPHLRRKLAGEIRDACINVGFFYVTGHGIKEEAIDSAIEAGRQFFALPDELKLKYDARRSSTFKGFNPLKSENNDPNNNGDLHEGWNIGFEALDTASKDTLEGGWKESAMAGGNVWPEEGEVANFRERVLTYYHAALNLGKSLFPLFALALDLDEHYFDDKTRESAAIMRVLHYPPQTGPHDDRVVGIGAHTDFECFTILYQQTKPPIQALQVLNAKGEWVNAVPLEGSLVINIGDQFARWTNDIFKSTVHRAINRTGVERYSMPLFFGTDYNVRLEPILSCVSAERPAKYEVMTAGEYVKARLQAAYATPMKATEAGA